MRRAVAALLRKELLIELRSWQSVPGMSLFALTTFVVFHFALNRSSVDGDLAAGILWVTLLFAAILGVNRLFVADAEEGGFDGFLLAPVDRGALLLAKVLALLLYLVALELVDPLIGATARRTRVITSHDPARGLAEADVVLGLRGGRPALLRAAGEVSVAEIGELYR